MIYNIEPLSSISDNPLLWGGKAVWLMRLINNGFLVPKGIVISTTEYRLYRTKRLDFESFETILEAQCNKILGYGDNIIFRSSATIEGSNDVACCGIFESYLYNPHMTYFQNVVRVWDSLFDVDSICYLQQSGVNIEDVAMSVIIQKLQYGTFSGVVQTYDTVNDVEQIIVDYSSDGIDAVVNGTSNANTIYINSHTGEITHFSCANCLSEQTINHIRRDCVLAEKIFHSHFEFEIQITENEIYYVQARSIL